MATPSDKLAQSFEVLRTLQGCGVFAVRTRDLTLRADLQIDGYAVRLIDGLA